MNKNLINFLTGETAIKVSTADDMKHFVNWLKKYDIQEILVSNKIIESDYYTITFWKCLAKEMWAKGQWKHPNLIKVLFVYQSQKMEAYLFEEDMKKWSGDIEILTADKL